MSRSLKSFAHLLRGEICWSSPLPEQVTSSTWMAVSSISGFALRSICTRLVILWWTHFFLHCHFLFSPLPLNKRKGHSSSRSSENKRPFGFSCPVCLLMWNSYTSQSAWIWEFLWNSQIAYIRQIPHKHWLYSQLFLRNSPRCLRANQGFLHIDPM